MTTGPARKTVAQGEWLGTVPASWQVTPLFTVLKETDERNSRLENRNLLSLSYGRIIRKDIDTIGGLLPESFDTYQIVRAGDVVLRLTDLQNDQRSLRVGFVPEQGIITSAYINLRAATRHSPRFLFYQLHNADIRKVFYNFGGGVRQSMKYADLKRLPIPLPPFEDQRAIAEFLDSETRKVDDLIAAQQKLNRLLQLRRALLITSAVWMQNGASEHDHAGGLPQLPHGWSVQKFKRVAFFQEGPGLRNWQFTDDGARVICVTNITEKGIDFEGYTKFISEEEYRHDYRRFTVQNGDLLLSSSGNSWGKVAEFKSDGIPTILNTSTIRVNELPSRPLTTRFIRWALQTVPVREQLRLAMTGACQPNFGPSHLGELRVPVPPTDMQEAIAARLDRDVGRMDVLVGKVGACADKLHELRSSLISAAVTGQIDVRNYRPQEAAALCQ